MKNKLTALLVLLLLPSWATADDIRFAPGISLQAAVTLVVDENGVLQIDRTKPILVGGITTTDVPVVVDPVKPEEPPTDPLVQKVPSLMAKAPKATNERQAISSLYKTISDLPLTMTNEIQQATSILFNALSMSQEWKTWKADVDVYAASLSADDVKRLWKLLAEAMLK